MATGVTGQCATFIRTFRVATVFLQPRITGALIYRQDGTQLSLVDTDIFRISAHHLSGAFKVT